MFLYLDMVLVDLDELDSKDVIRTLSPELRSVYRQYRPMHFTPAEAKTKARAAKSAIVTGVPHFVKSNTDFTGFIMIPMQMGKTTTMMMVPIIDCYDVYEVRDIETAQDFLVAHARGSRKLPKKPTIMGGVIKKLQGNKKKKPKHKLFLNTLYYTPLGS